MSKPSSSTSFTSVASSLPPPIVYTIAGSDSGGGAGIQADLHAIHSMGCHGCSAVTCLTAQNSQGVSGVHAPPVSFLRSQLDALLTDMPPRAVKIGMLFSADLAEEVGRFLKEIRENAEQNQTEPPLVVLDPVMISTSGHKLIDDSAKDTIIQKVFPYADVLTPNKFEAEELLGRKLRSPEDIEQGAKELLAMGISSVLIKGGHSLADSSTEPLSPDVNATIGYAQDYFLSSEGPLSGRKDEMRLCDGSRGVWLRTNRYDSPHTHGTGCTLSSAIASALAAGHQQRSMVNGEDASAGAIRAIRLIDACCLAKAYVTAGIGRGVRIGQGPGPVVHTNFPSSHHYFPSIALDPKRRTSETPAFLRMKSALSSSKTLEAPTLGTILPIADSIDWVERLVTMKGITDLQLRIKGESLDMEAVRGKVRTAQALCRGAGVRLWINDYWSVAVEEGCFGVHLGQEDLAKFADEGGLEILQKSNLALGVSTHSFAELAAALGVRPSYVSLGPVFGTKSKNVAFDPQGLSTVRKWRDLIDPNIPLVVIGGIGDADAALKAKEAGADCVAVIGAVTQASDAEAAVDLLVDTMS